MTELHAKIEVLEGELPGSLAGAATELGRRAFTVVTLTRSDGTAGVGEASPLPGYSPDSLDEVTGELRRLASAPLPVDPLGSPFEALRSAFDACPAAHPSSRFAIETALLDWLGRTRALPVHRIVAGRNEGDPIPIADLVFEPDPARWPSCVDSLVEGGATHLKLKIGADLDREVEALRTIRAAHPALPLRVDGNRRVDLGGLRRVAAALEALELELVEEPVNPAEWLDASTLPLPFALDETLVDRSRAWQLLDTGRIRAVVLKPMLLGGFQACFEIAERAAQCGADFLVSHSFDGPIARAATAELALALRTPLAAGLGPHPGLSLWPPHRIAAVEGREIRPHASPGLGLQLEETDE